VELLWLISYFKSTSKAWEFLWGLPEANLKNEDWQLKKIVFSRTYLNAKER